MSKTLRFITNSVIAALAFIAMSESSDTHAILALTVAVMKLAAIVERK